jgi:hypothetical protein
MAFGINVPVGFKLNPAGLRSAKKEFSSLGDSVKSGLKFAGIAVGLGEIVNVMKESVKAAAMDNKSQKLLALQLMTTVHATKEQTKATEAYLGKLSMSVGIVDDLLRPALANAVRGTGSLAKGQKLLGIALDGAAATGKPLNAVMQALIKASNGQTGALYKLAPQLKATKGNLDDFAASVKGAAQANADPFARMQVAIDELKEKFGRLLLPMVIKFVDYLTKTVVPAVSQFLDQVGNPKTDVGKTFLDIKKAVEQTFKGVRDFFALFGGGDAMKGFANIAGVIIRLLPALLALKSIMFLSSAGSAIGNLVKAVALIRGTGGGGGGVAPAGAAGGASTVMKLLGPVSFLATGAVALLEGSKITGAAEDARLKKYGVNVQAYHAAVDQNPYSGRLNPLGTQFSYNQVMAMYSPDTVANAPLKGKGVPPTVINVNVQPGTSGHETAKQLVKLLATFDKINGTNIVTKKGR